MNANDIDFKTCYLSDPGVFIKNKGCFVYQELKYFAFWLVVDGVDFVPEKGSAQLVVDQLCADLAENIVLSRSYIRKSLNKAHLLLKNVSSGINLKASLVLVVTDYSEIIWAVSGNSRLYLIREGQLAFRSRDQSVAQSLVESDIIDEDGMNSVADRDILTNYLGIEFGFAPFISNRFRLHDGDILILCNLGFWERIGSATFSQLLQTASDSEPTELLAALKKQFLDQESQTLNNYIVGLVAAKRVLKKGQHGLFKFNTFNITNFNSWFNAFRLNKKQAAVILAVLLCVGGLIAARVMPQTKLQKENLVKTIQTITQKNTITDYEKKGDRLAKKGNYVKATAQYEQALAILSTCLDKRTEATIRLKVSIILMLKDGDAFLAQQHYENALSRYETAQNFDTIKYFHIQIDNKLANVRRLLEEQRISQSFVPMVAKNALRTAAVQHNNYPDSIKPNPNVTASDRTKQNEPASSNRPQTNKVTVRLKVTNKNDSNQPHISKEATLKPVAKQTENIKKVTDTIRIKPVSKAIASSLPSKRSPKPTTAVAVDRGKLNQAAVMIRKGDELLGERKFREAVRCYKKAKSIYQKLGMFTKAKSLAEKIKATKKMMRRSFEGAH
jgi:serine/threonine protein phosphatase PrpC